MSSPSESLESSRDAAANVSDTPSLNIPHALSSAQERRLMDYFDEHVLQIQREYKKRNYEGSSLRTLSAYLKAVRPLLTLILMIPPIEKSAYLRTALLLRLTGDILECAPGYPPDDLPELLEVLDQLDKGWLAVLRSQVWDPDSCRGEDLIVPAGLVLHSSPISQTDRIRLRSLLVLATDKLEEWLENKVDMGRDELQGVTDALQTLDIQQKFDEIFGLTLSEMGELRGNE